MFSYQNLQNLNNINEVGYTFFVHKSLISLLKISHRKFAELLQHAQSDIASSRKKKFVDFFFPHGDQRKGIVVYNEQSIECKDYQKIPGEDQRKTRE